MPTRAETPFVDGPGVLVIGSAALHGNLAGLQERLRQNVDLDHFASRGVNLLKLAMTY
jgi:hypothetical protein